MGQAPKAVEPLRKTLEALLGAKALKPGRAYVLRIYHHPRCGLPAGRGACTRGADELDAALEEARPGAGVRSAGGEVA